MENDLTNIVKIENVVAHLYNRVSYEDILAWLNNFSNDADKATALQLLGYLNLFTSDRIYDTLKYYLGKIVKDFTEDIYILAVKKKEVVDSKTKIPKRAKVLEGCFGGQSGQLITYYARKVTEEYYANVVILEECDLKRIRKEYKHTHCVIVLIDDIFGTGDTVLEYYTRLKKKNKLRPQWTVIALAVAYMKTAETVLDHEGIKTYGEKIMPVFDAIRDTEWTDENRADDYLQLALGYGVMLHKEKEKRLKPLGYKNSQALVAFEYGVPNNTLPIIWENKYIKRQKKPWTPLFPRNLTSRLSIYSKNKDNIQRCYLMAWKQGIRLKDLKFNDLPLHSALRLFSVLSILAHHKDSVIISNALCMSENEFQEIIKVAHQNDLIDSTMTLKEKAIMALSQIRERNASEINSNIVNDQIYLP